jgi:hypothetical protein
MMLLLVGVPDHFLLPPWAAMYIPFDPKKFANCKEDAVRTGVQFRITIVATLWTRALRLLLMIIHVTFSLSFSISLPWQVFALSCAMIEKMDKQ